MKKFNLLCMGDSLTEGYNIDKKNCWVSLLKDRKGWNIENAGISGDMTAGMLARLPIALEKDEYTHVFIMGGTNDVEFGLAPNLIISNIKAIMRQLRYLGIHYTIGIPLPFNKERSTLTRFEYVSCGKVYSERMDEFCEELKSFLLFEEANFIDLRDCFRKGKGKVSSDLFLEDGVHPNEKGHEIIYKRMVEHYSKLI